MTDPVAGVVAVLAAVVALTTTAGTGEPTPQRVVLAAMLPATDTACVSPVRREATDAAVLLRIDITDRQRLDLQKALRSDPTVRDVRFESRDQPYARFTEVPAGATAEATAEAPALAPALLGEDFIGS